VKRPEMQAGFASVALLLALVQTAAAQTAAAQPVPAPDATRASHPQSSEAPPALELSGSLGPTLTFGEAANPEYTRSVGRVGVLLGAAVAYRSSYFVAPRLEVGYAALAHGESELPMGPWGDGGKLEQRLRTWVISPGVSGDLWRFRPRLGLGIAFVSQANSYAGQTHSSSQLAISTQLGLGFQLIESGPLRLDVDARFVDIGGAGITFASLGLVGRWDALTFASDSAGAP
jgi:hypothetical protein